MKIFTPLEFIFFSEDRKDKFGHNLICKLFLVPTSQLCAVEDEGHLDLCLPPPGHNRYIKTSGFVLSSRRECWEDPSVLRLSCQLREQTMTSLLGEGCQSQIPQRTWYPADLWNKMKAILTKKPSLSLSVYV